MILILKRSIKKQKMRNFKSLMLFAIAIVTTISCSSDDDSSSNPEFDSSVPQGEIVPLELRDVTLTGFSYVTTSGKNQTEESQKWWNYNIGELISANCEEYNEVISLSDYYFAFSPDGKLLYKIGLNGVVYNDRTWQWTSSAKESIYLDNETDVKFTITYLNDNNVCYASIQHGEGCTVTTYEHMNNPHFE
jgi:hypothetical protein